VPPPAEPAAEGSPPEADAAAAAEAPAKREPAEPEPAEPEREPRAESSVPASEVPVPEETEAESFQDSAATADVTERATKHDEAEFPPATEMPAETAIVEKIEPPAEPMAPEVRGPAEEEAAREAAETLAAEPADLSSASEPTTPDAAVPEGEIGEREVSAVEREQGLAEALAPEPSEAAPEPMLSPPEEEPEAAAAEPVVPPVPEAPAETVEALALPEEAEVAPAEEPGVEQAQAHEALPHPIAATPEPAAAGPSEPVAAAEEMPAVTPEEPPPPEPASSPEPEPVEGLTREELAALETSVFPQFFNGFIGPAQALYHARKELRGLRSAIAAGTGPLEPLEAIQSDDVLRQEALALLDAWERIKLRGERDTPVGLQTFFSLLGCGSPTIYRYTAPARHAVDTLVEFECQTIADRDVLAVPEFGSLAQGRYRIVLAWERLSLQHMMRRIGAGLTEPGGPVIVLAFRSLDRAERLSLARYTASDPGSAGIVVLDELVLLYLMQHRGNRLKALFDCTLPFTAVAPFTTGDEAVPSELFAGWGEQRRAVLSDDAPPIILIAGGKGVGKTVLLKRLLGDHAADPRFRFSLLLDVSRVGREGGLRAADLTGLMAEALRDRGLPVPLTTSSARFEEALGDWLNEPRGGGRRRVLVGLDDADSLIAADAPSGYAELRRLRDMVQRLGRLFRLAITGGAGVEGLSRDPASPLAGMILPARIGLASDQVDRLELTRLLVRPLETLGFKFAEPDAIDLLLDRAGHEPGLVRLTAARLLDLLRHAVRETQHPSMPHRIETPDVARACDAVDLGALITARARPALEFDPRFEIASLIMAQVGEAGATGLTPDQVGERAVALWPESVVARGGGRETEALLEEMADFGLVRRIGDRRYRLHPAVLAALGDEGAMERRRLALGAAA
jgi:hypothetical protein